MATAAVVVASPANTAVAESKTSQHGSKRGWLFKWTNYLKGYQRRWFVLENGLLSYYRNEPTGGPKISTRRKRRTGRASENPSEMSHTCRGTISLHGALIHTVDACTFVLSNGGTQTFHIKAATEVERQEWVTALELAKAKAIQAMESDEDEEAYQSNDSQKIETPSAIKDLQDTLETLRKWNDLLTKRGTMLQRALTDLESTEINVVGPELGTKLKSVNEKATQFRIAANAMIKSSDEYLQLSQQQEPKWKKMLQHEHDQKVRFEQMFEQLSRQYSSLEEAAQHALPGVQPSRSTHSAPGNRSPSEDDDEFYDAQESDTFTLGVTNEGLSSIERAEAECNNYSQGSDDGSSSEGDRGQMDTTVYVMMNDSMLRRTNDVVEHRATLSGGNNNNNNNVTADAAAIADSETDGAAWSISRKSAGSNGTRRKRRTRVPEKPNYPLNLWSIMKNCIGKDLSKIPMPVNFSEPLSMLQRLTEDYEYAEILDKAAECTDYCEQMAYVAAFTISSYSTTAARTGKPFNPLLGETFECDRSDDLGWRAFSEQVSHHPPMSAQYCEGKSWRCWQEFTMTSKFRGKYLQIYPLGTVHLEFKDGDHHYTWHKVTTTVHNIVVGKLWVDQSGDTDIVDHKQGIKCHLKYVPYSYFARDSQRKVKGVVMDASKKVKWVVQGTWDDKVEIAPVTSTSGPSDNPVYQTGPYVSAWKRRLPPDDCEKYYNFTELACQLNELEENVAPTDSRLRPDQRLMENGQWVEANAEKIRLEEKQRAERRAREALAEKSAAQGLPYTPHEPVWFKKQEDRFTNSLCHVYTGEYWACKNKQEWSRCPKIY